MRRSTNSKEVCLIPSLKWGRAPNQIVIKLTMDRWRLGIYTHRTNPLTPTVSVPLFRDTTSRLIGRFQRIEVDDTSSRKWWDCCHWHGWRIGTFPDHHGTICPSSWLFFLFFWRINMGCCYMHGGIGNGNWHVRWNGNKFDRSRLLKWMEGGDDPMRIKGWVWYLTLEFDVSNLLGIDLQSQESL